MGERSSRGRALALAVITFGLAAPAALAAPFQAQPGWPQAVSGPLSGLELLDLRGDARREVLVGTPRSAFLASDLGSLAPIGEPGFGPVVPVDFDGDGDTDLVTADTSAEGRIAVRENNATWTTETFELGDGISDIELFDHDGDEHLDLVVARSGMTPGLDVLYGSDEGFEDPVTVTERTWVTDLEVADVDGDGASDLVAAAPLPEPYDPRVSLPASGGPSEPMNDPGVPSVDAHEIELGDLDGDGDLDALGARSGDLVRATFGEGAFDESQELGFRAFDVALEDFDGDGDLDAFTGSDEGGGLITFRDGAGTLERVLTTVMIGQVAAGDVDGDGKPDVAALQNGPDGDLVHLAVTRPVPLVPAGEPARGDEPAAPSPAVGVPPPVRPVAATRAPRCRRVAKRGKTVLVCPSKKAKPRCKRVERNGKRAFVCPKRKPARKPKRTPAVATPAR